MGYIYNVPVDSTMRQLLNCSSYIARVNFYKYNTARISARTHYMGTNKQSRIYYCVVVVLVALLTIAGKVMKVEIEGTTTSVC